MTKNIQILIYQTEDGKTKIATKLEDETVWLTQEQMAELFQKSRSPVNEHIKNTYEEKELEEIATMNDELLKLGPCIGDGYKYSYGKSQMRNKIF